MNTAPSLRALWWAMIVFAGCYLALFVFFPGLFLFVGVNHFGVWFLDTYAILATNDAMSAGIDPYAFNPLDPFGRSHAYTHWWLHLRDFGLTRADNFALGAAFVLAFFLAAVARLRPRTPGELVWYLAVLCSSPVLLAVNRANNDLLIFVLLAPLVPCLLSRRRSLRLATVLLIALGASLKFYPAVGGLVLLAGDDAREVRGRVIFGLVALGLVALNLARDLAMLGMLTPKAEGIMTFGAVNLLAAVGVAGWGVPVTTAVVAGAIFLGFWRSRMLAEWEIAPESRAAWWSFVLGAVLLTGCFFTGRNFAYRWVFALWMAPWLWQQTRDSLAPVAVRRLARATAALLLFALWFDPLTSTVLGACQGRVPAETILRWADRIFLLEQPITWAFFACLLGFLAQFTRQGVRTLLGRA
jgi:hypothetical protein